MTEDRAMTTRSSTISSHSLRVSRRWAVLGLTCVLWLAGTLSPALAQNTVFYRDTNGLHAMTASGTKSQLVFPYKSFTTSPIDGVTHQAALSCSQQAHNGALVWLDILDDDPANVAGGNAYSFGTLYQVVTNAAGTTSLTRLSNFDFTNRKVGLVNTGNGAVWAAGDTFISFSVADYSGATPLLTIARFPVANLGVTMMNETNIETVLSVAAGQPGFSGADLQHDWSPDGSLLAYCNEYSSGASVFTQIVLLNVNTGAQQVLVDQGQSGLAVDFLQYAPDGTRVAFSTSGGTAGGNLYTIAVTGGLPFLVAASGTTRNGTSTWYDSPRWSPDSSGLTMLLWQRTRFNVFTYYVGTVSSTGGGVINLTPKEQGDSGPVAWR